MEQNYTHYKGSDVLVQLNNILKFLYERFNELEVDYDDLCHEQNKKHPAEPIEEYTNLFGFAAVVLKVNVNAQIKKKLTIDNILYNYFVVNQPKLYKQFKRRKVHNCIHKKMEFYAKCFWKEFNKVGAAEMQMKYETSI